MRLSESRQTARRRHRCSSQKLMQSASGLHRKWFKNIHSSAQTAVLSRLRVPWVAAVTRVGIARGAGSFGTGKCVRIVWPLSCHDSMSLAFQARSARQLA
mmetsp:Transcript_52205/g.151700  ORF Transcript_52205/g.151700 Transcript_52205/m.151700 type:complete len:100 (+) Transcript_52205:404-703(+)